MSHTYFKDVISLTELIDNNTIYFIPLYSNTNLIGEQTFTTCNYEWFISDHGYKPNDWNYCTIDNPEICSKYIIISGFPSIMKFTQDNLNCTIIFSITKSLNIVIRQYSI
jgi:hypothetical protein